MMKTLLLALLLLLPRIFYAQSAAPERLALTGARIYTAPGKPPVENGIVITRGGKITAAGTSGQIKIPAGMKVLDCKGLVLMAGFWNSHVHFMEPAWFNAATQPAATLTRQMQRMLTGYGFTHAFDLACLDFPNLLALKARVQSGEVKGPAILTAGVPFAPPNGSPFYIRPLKLREIGVPEEAAAYAARQLADGADGIKLWSASPDGHGIVPMPLEIVKAAAGAAHRLHKPVFAHPTADTGLSIAIAGGVDVLAHVSPDGYRSWTPEEITLIQQHHMAVIPTLKLYKWELERNGVTDMNNPLMTTALQQLGALAKAGGEILFGTDVGYVTDYSTTEEFLFLSQAGLNFDQILAALTTAPAKRFGKEASSGRIAKGMDADIVLLKADPHTDIRHFSEVAYTIRNGEIIYDYRKDR
ncbi:amidohydrolase family protein [Chitinophaga solisilvae]|uniref:amidohydrolase family protein n=1 Tax=Chitinophaga solisilvae TaxID=1233460 RepID=UPI00136A789A|nr:amidohydrolase family protein [Chitinophaga solisilvae]